MPGYDQACGPYSEGIYREHPRAKAGGHVSYIVPNRLLWRS